MLEPFAAAASAPEQVAAWRDALLARPLRAATVRRKLSALSALYGELVAAGAARRNPVERIERPDLRADARPAPVLIGRQARLLLDAPSADRLKGLRDRAILAVLLHHGLTRRELRRLETGDLVRGDVARGGPELLLRVMGRRARVLAVHPEAVERIGAWLERVSHGGDAADPLFWPMAGRSGGLVPVLFLSTSAMPGGPTLLELHGCTVHRYAMDRHGRLAWRGFRALARRGSRQRGSVAAGRGNPAADAAPVGPALRGERLAWRSRRLRGRRAR